MSKIVDIGLLYTDYKTSETDALQSIAMSV